MKHKEGDKIVCVIDTYDTLTYAKIYDSLTPIGWNDYYFIIDDDNIGWSYPKRCFITLGDYREQQISKILSNV